MASSATTTPYLDVSTSIDSEQHTITFHLVAVGFVLNDEHKTQIRKTLGHWAQVHSGSDNTFGDPELQEANQGTNLVVGYRPHEFDADDCADLITGFLGGLSDRYRFKRA